MKKSKRYVECTLDETGRIETQYHLNIPKLNWLSVLCTIFFIIPDQISSNLVLTRVLYKTLKRPSVYLLALLFLFDNGVINNLVNFHKHETKAVVAFSTSLESCSTFTRVLTIFRQVLPRGLQIWCGYFTKWCARITHGFRALKNLNSSLRNS